jgi:hypothetical protein
MRAINEAGGPYKPGAAQALKAWDDMLGVLRTWPDTTADSTSDHIILGGLD